MDPDRDLTVRDVCRLLQRGRTFVYANAAQLGAYRSGTQGLRFTRDGIEAWRERQRLAPVVAVQSEPTPIRRGRIADLMRGQPNPLDGRPFGAVR